MRLLYLAGWLLLTLSCTDTERIIRIKGSDTEVNLAALLAEEFYHEHPDLLVSVSGGGSGLGIASLLNGNADIANSSRIISNKERTLFAEKNIELGSFIFAQDALAFVVSAENPVDSISIAHLSEILSGEEKNWQFLSGIEMPVNIYGRQGNSGTYEYVKHKLGIDFSPYAKQMNGNAQILEAIRADNSGIGYVGAGYVMAENIRGLKILRVYSEGKPAISPLDAEKIISGEYHFQRPLYQYYKAADYHKVSPFLDFEKTPRGAEIIQSSGYYPAKENDQ